MVFIYIQIDTINISYDVYGSGSPVVMLHGWGANKNTFKKVIEEIKSEHKVYSLDLPGFGDSQIGLPLNLYEVVEIIKKFIIALNITNPIIISHSYGTRLAIIYASKYEVSKLVLISAAGIKTKLKLSKRLNILIYKTAKRLGINLKSGSSDYRNADNVKRRMLVDAVNRDLQKEMKLIKCPTLLIYGEKDTSTPITIGKKINSLIKGSQMIVLDDCSHFPYLEKTTIFNMILNSFLLF